MSEKWNIVTDSSCDLTELEIPEEDITFSTVPFIIRAGDAEFIDDENLNTEEMVNALSAIREAGRTSCPSPETWLEKFSRPGKIVAMTISSNLSGSYNSACLARDMILEKDPTREIAVIDSLSTGPEMIMMVRRLCALAKDGLSFGAAVEKVKQFAEQTHLIFALSSFDNLVKNGRVGRLAGFVAGKLGLWGIGVASDEGTIDVRSKVRGKQAALKAIIGEMKARAFTSGPVVICHCLNEEMAGRLKSLIQETFQKVQVDILPTRGLCSFYAEKGGMIIGY